MCLFMNSFLSTASISDNDIISISPYKIIYVHDILKKYLSLFIVS
jgi:hypothetical protein